MTSSGATTGRWGSTLVAVVVAAGQLSAAPTAVRPDAGEPGEAVRIGTIGASRWLPGLRAPAVAVSDSGTVYAFWVRPVQKDAPRPTGLGRFTDTMGFTPTTQETEWHPMPTGRVRRDGKWGEAGALTTAGRIGSPRFAWCDGEKVHLLLDDGGNTDAACDHLVYDPAGGAWTRVGPLPAGLDWDARFRRVGRTVHAATVDHGVVHYLRFDGTAWARPVRVENWRAAQARLAVGRDGTVRLAWWAGRPGDRPIYGYGVVTEGRVTAEPLSAGDFGIEDGLFDLDTGPDGRVLLAYKAISDEPRTTVVRARWRADDGWSAAEEMGRGGQTGFDPVRLIGGDRRTFATWLIFDPTSGRRSGDQLWGQTAVTDGRQWSAARALALQGAGKERQRAWTRYMGLAVDKDGAVHAVWVSNPDVWHGVVAQLGPPSKDR